MRILLTGAAGQLGTDLQDRLRGEDLIALTHTALEVTDPQQVSEALAHYRPDVVINTAAFHQVDRCETEIVPSFEVNACVPRYLALVCKAQDAVLVHFSTNYVFDGRSQRPYQEEDPAHPVNVYGVSKLAGEKLIRFTWPKHYIIRTAGLYGVAGSRGKGGNFIETMLRLGRERGQVTVVADQYVAPTYTADLAEVVARLIRRADYGTYHVTNSGACNYAEFARTIFTKVGLQATVEPITTEAFGAPADRPRNGVLDNAKFIALGEAALPSWDTALENYLRAKGYM